MLVAMAMVMMYLLCIDDYYRVKVLRWIGFDLLVGAACGTIALIIFGAMGDGRNFMPDWEHNYLSWSFGLAFVGVVMMYVTAVLFLVEARIMQRKELARDQQEKQQYPMERSV
jgi:multisubunit Na+/H+ antiporter MnhB subunit